LPKTDKFYRLVAPKKAPKRKLSVFVNDSRIKKTAADLVGGML
jgi:hypothetical protein